MYVLGVAMLLTACNIASNKETEHSIIGEWDNHSTFDGKPWRTLGRFKADGTVDVIGNGKLIISQKYSVSGDTIFFREDPFCDPNSVGAYKLTYFGDSVKIDLISDDCPVRIRNADKMRMGRVKN